MGGDEAKAVSVTCAEAGCGKEFEISAGEQAFYKRKELTMPKRCEACRAKRKAQGVEKPAVRPQVGPIGEAIAEAKKTGRWDDERVKRGNWRDKRHRDNRRGRDEDDGGSY